MTRRNIVYILSDNLDPRDRHHPRDMYLRSAKAAMETYYAPPIGNHQIEFVNTLEEVVEDLLTRFPGGEDKPGSVVIVAHGARGFRRTTGPQSGLQNVFAVNLPVTGAIQSPLDADHLFKELVDLRVSLHERPKMSALFSNFIFHQVDSETSLTFFGCYLGRDQKIMDLFRNFLGGNLTVFAPKLEQVFNIVPIEGGQASLASSRTVGALMEKGLLPASGDALYAALGTWEFAERLKQVYMTPKDRFEAQSLYSLGWLPVFYLLPPDQDDLEKNRIFPNRQDVETAWGVSLPAGKQTTSIQLQNRLNKVFPGVQPTDSGTNGKDLRPAKGKKVLDHPAGSGEPAIRIGHRFEGTITPELFADREAKARATESMRRMMVQQAENTRIRLERDAEYRRHREVERQEEMRRRQLEDVRRTREAEETRRRGSEEMPRRADEAARRDKERKDREDAERRRSREMEQKKREDEARRRDLQRELSKVKVTHAEIKRPILWTRPIGGPPPGPPPETGAPTFSTLKNRPTCHVEIGGPIVTTLGSGRTFTSNVPGKWPIR